MTTKKTELDALEIHVYIKPKLSVSNLKGDKIFFIFNEVSVSIFLKIETL